MSKTKTKATKKKPTHASSFVLGPYQVGATVVIRAIPFHYIGTIDEITDHGVTLAAGAVWLSDSKRWGSEFLLAGQVNETEPYCDRVFIRANVIADITAWRHPIPGQV